MTSYAKKRSSAIDMTNIINDIRIKYSVDIIIETTVDDAFQVKAWRQAHGNRELSAFSKRNCVGDALMDLESELKKK